MLSTTQKLPQNCNTGREQVKFQNAMFCVEYEKTDELRKPDVLKCKLVAKRWRSLDSKLRLVISAHSGL